MKILVTGSSGFIGRQVVGQLIRRQVDVIGCSRSPTHVRGAHHVAVDLTIPGAAKALVENVRPTHLLHLAWNAAPGIFWNAGDNLDWCAASLELVRAFYAADGQRAVLAGSCAEYDWTCDALLDEYRSPTNPATLYGVTKDALRRMVLNYAHQHTHAIAWGRIFWLYGPGETSGRLVSDVAGALCKGETPAVSEGAQKRDFLHVADVASAFVAALFSDYRGIFNVCSGSAVPVRDVVQCLADAMGKQNSVRFGARRSNPAEPPVLYGSVDRLYNDIGFKPNFDLRGGLKNTAEWWCQRPASYS
jgi:nucleoside-diphosphate-sugar epimerase